MGEYAYLTGWSGNVSVFVCKSNVDNVMKEQGLAIYNRPTTRVILLFWIQSVILDAWWTIVISSRSHSQLAEQTCRVWTRVWSWTLLISCGTCTFTSPAFDHWNHPPPRGLWFKFITFSLSMLFQSESWI